MLRTKFIALIAALAAACTATSGGSDRGRPVERTFASMGTELRLTAWTTDEAAANAAFEAVFQEMNRLEGLLSNWRDDSEIQQLNRAAGKQPVPVGPEMRELLEAAHQISDWTNGKFDVTWGALSGLWKFDYQNRDGT